MKIVFTRKAWADYEFWEKSNPKRADRIRKLSADMRDHPFEGIGKPEPLRFHLQGQWSRRIDQSHRLVYFVEKGIITIISCRYHY